MAMLLDSMKEGIGQGASEIPVFVPVQENHFLSLQNHFENLKFLKQNRIMILGVIDFMTSKSIPNF